MSLSGQRFRGRIRLEQDARAYGPGDVVSGIFSLTANERIFLKHAYAGYSCKSTTSLLKQDQKPFLNGVRPEQMLGVEDHFLVNYEHEVLTVPRYVSQHDHVDLPFEVRLPKLDRKYDECNVHTFPRRDALLDHIPRKDRCLPPRAKYKVSGHPVITVCHYIKVEVCVEVNGEEEWQEEVQMVPFEQNIEKIPRNWRHLLGEDGKLLPDFQEKSTIVNLHHSFSKGSSKINARLLTQFSNHSLLKSPLGPTRRCIISDCNVNEFLQFSVNLPTDSIRLPFHQRKVHIVETKIILVREATVIGGIHCGTEYEYSYKKQRKVYTNDLILGQWYGRERVEVVFDEDQATIDLPQKLFRFTIGRTGESLKACNFSVDSKLLVKVRLMVGHCEMELLDTVPVMLLMPQRPSCLEIVPEVTEVNEIKAQEDEPEKEVGEKEAERFWVAVKRAILRRLHRRLKLFSSESQNEAAWDENQTEGTRKDELRSVEGSGIRGDLYGETSKQEGSKSSRPTKKETSSDLRKTGAASNGDSSPNEETASNGELLPNRTSPHKTPEKRSSKKTRDISLSKPGSSNRARKSKPNSNEGSPDAIKAPKSKFSQAKTPEERRKAGIHGIDVKIPRPKNISDETLVEKEKVPDRTVKAGKIEDPLPASSSGSDQTFVDCSESLA